MVVRFVKGAGRGKDLLVCERAGGSVTGSRFRAIHDLAHYAVETTFGLRDAFYGLVEKGWDIDTFDTPGAVKALDIPLEAGQTEFVVGLLEIELLNGGAYEDFVGQVEAMCRQNGTEPPAWLTADGAAAARMRFRSLLDDWGRVAAGAALELEFAAGGAGTS